MSYFVIATFDIKNSKSSDYEVANEILADIGLENSVIGSSGNKLTLPNNTYAGEFEGEGAGKIRQDVCDRISESFKKSNLKASVFVTVGGDWAWGKRST